MLSVTDEKYPSWGENMTEVVTADSQKSASADYSWRVDFTRYPKYSK